MPPARPVTAIHRVLLGAVLVVLAAVWWVGAVTVAGWLFGLGAEQALDPRPKLIEEPLGRSCEKQDRYDRCQIGYQIDAENIHSLHPCSNHWFTFAVA